jgi:hypothetical protein
VHARRQLDGLLRLGNGRQRGEQEEKGAQK